MLEQTAANREEEEAKKLAEEEEERKPDRLALLLSESKFSCNGVKNGYYADETYVVLFDCNAILIYLLIGWDVKCFIIAWKVLNIVGNVPKIQFSTRFT